MPCQLCAAKKELMRWIQKILSERVARNASAILQIISYLAVLLGVICLVLAFLGRQTYDLHTPEASRSDTFYADTSPEDGSSYMTVSSNDRITVSSAPDGRVDLGTHIGLTAMYTVGLLPWIAAFLLLAQVFGNVSKGEIFTEKNARFLLYYGLLQLGNAIVVPPLKLLIARVANMLTQSQIAVSTGQNFFDLLIPSLAFIVAAYIIHYGIALQDEVDHTL